MRFQGKRVLVTGAAGGLGSALAAEFSKLGADLFLTDRNEEGLEAVRGALSSRALPCDVTSQASVDALRRRVESEMGGLDVLVNCAGVLTHHGFESSVEQLRRLMAVNVEGYVRVTMAFLPHLCGQMDGGKRLVIMVASMAGLIVPPNLQFYAISKAAVRASCRALRQHLQICGAKRTRVMCVLPPQFDTRLYEGTDLQNWIERERAKGRLPRPEEFAREILKAARKGRRELYPSRLGKLAAVGARLSPRLMDYFARRYYLKNQRPHGTRTRELPARG
ncbi:MAG: SDR family NAD(P)-dependent oxidoreductase [Promethearchaeota archaeon]